MGEDQVRQTKTRHIQMDNTGEILPEESFAEIQAGTEHFLALTKDGVVYAWGNNRFGQCGQSAQATEIIWRPFKVDRIKNAKQIVAYEDSSFVVTKDGKLYAWGKNEWGQLATGSYNPENLPVEVF